MLQKLHVAGLYSWNKPCTCVESVHPPSYTRGVWQQGGAPRDSDEEEMDAVEDDTEEEEDED